MDNKNIIKTAILNTLINLRVNSDPNQYIYELVKQIDIYEEEFPSDDLLIILITLRDSLLYIKNHQEHWYNIKENQYSKIYDILVELFSIKINDVLVTDKLIEFEKIGVIIPL